MRRGKEREDDIGRKRVGSERREKERHIEGLGERSR